LGEHVVYDPLTQTQTYAQTQTQLQTQVLFRESGVCLVWFSEDKTTGFAFFVFFVRETMASPELDGRGPNLQQ